NAQGLASKPGELGYVGTAWTNRGFCRGAERCNDCLSPEARVRSQADPQRDYVKPPERFCPVPASSRDSSGPPAAGTEEDDNAKISGSAPCRGRRNPHSSDMPAAGRPLSRSAAANSSTVL